MDTTVIIVSYKSDHLIEKNIAIFDKEIKIIIIDNSQNKNLKENIENNHENVTVILNSNKGFGQAANLGAKLAKTKYVFFCSPDNYVEKNAIHELKKICKNLKDEFGILILSEKKEIISKNIKIEKQSGALCFFIQRKIFLEMSGFDENFFLYYEDQDLLKRFLDKKHTIYKIPIRYTNLLGSHDKIYNYPIEINRNWHYMWSMFYYKKKHHGYFYSFFSTLPILIRSLIRVAINFKKPEKKDIYLARFKGLYNSYKLKKSWYRPRID